MNRTPAQYAADRRRSHKAKAKKEQRFTARMFPTLRVIAANQADGFYESDTFGDIAQALATSARLGRKHLNFVLTGQFEDFV